MNLYSASMISSCNLYTTQSTQVHAISELVQHTYIVHASSKFRRASIIIVHEKGNGSNYCTYPLSIDVCALGDQASPIPARFELFRDSMLRKFSFVTWDEYIQLRRFGRYKLS